MTALKLKRPLLSIDTETTGTDPATDRIVEIAYVRLAPDGTRTSGRQRVNPGIPIPPDATKVHGITDADVAPCRPFAQLTGAITRRLTDCDLVGYNLRAFDLPLLRAEYARAGAKWPCDGAHVIDALVIFRERKRHSLVDAVQEYLHREHIGAHGALADAEATLDVFLAQLDRYTDLPRDLAALEIASGGRRPDWATECGRVRWNSAGEAVLAFSKHDGTPLHQVERGFLGWVVKNSFPEDLKALCQRALDGKRITPEVARG